ncbi:phage major capsid protein [Nonomuraea sp. NPDC050310]|uniref:phage major capsid protein n=1 Tax=Nonomuraea sp. NPDC050310 TaxID=3154935 RepID=UPI0033D54C21
MDVNALKQERARLAKQARDIMNVAEAASRGMTGEEETEFDRLMEQADRVERTIEREEQLREQEKRIADRNPPKKDPAPGVGDDVARAEAAWRTFLRDGRAGLNAEQVRALNMGSDPEGGYLVAPQHWVEQLIKNIDDAVPLRGLATVMTLTQGESLGVPTLDTDLADADWTSELGTGNQDDSLRFGARELRPHPLAKRVKISRTLLRRAAMNPETIVRERMAYKFGVTTEKAFMTGDGNQKPLGLFTASSQGISTARDRDIKISGSGFDSTNGASADDLIDIKFALKAAYHPRARWLFHRTVLAEIRKLKTTDNQYIWQAGLAGDRPDTILDIPYVLSEWAPAAIADEAYVGMLGDFSNYWIVDTLAFDVQRLVELYAESNQIGFIGRQEIDAMPVLEEAFIRIQAEAN